MKVLYGEKFRQHLQNFPKADLLKILAFVKHVEQYGLTGLTGRNKSSDQVPTNHPNWLERVMYAKKYNLWHYHIGIPYYIGEVRDLTSEYVLHYMLGDDQIVLVDLSAHPPLLLPREDYLQT